MSVTDADGNCVKDGIKVRLVEKGTEDTGIGTLSGETLKNKVYDLNGILISDEIFFQMILDICLKMEVQVLEYEVYL